MNRTNSRTNLHPVQAPAPSAPLVELQQNLIDLTPDALHVVRRTLDGARLSKDAVLVAKWVIDNNLRILAGENGEHVESPEVIELANVLSIVRGKA